MLFISLFFIKNIMNSIYKKVNIYKYFNIKKEKIFSYNIQ